MGYRGKIKIVSKGHSGKKDKRYWLMWRVIFAWTQKSEKRKFPVESTGLAQLCGNSFISASELYKLSPVAVT